MVSDGDTAGVLQCWKEFISVATDGVTARVVKYVKKSYTALPNGGEAVMS